MILPNFVNMIELPDIKEYPKMTVKELMQWKKKLESMNEFITRELRRKVYNGHLT